jgi:2,3-bisphosphoglycerate-dependent phosphoglycerate mutase
MAPKRVWLIRHGESEANAGRRTPSHIQTGLTTAGHEQAEKLAQRWEKSFGEPPQLIVTSPFLRTKQTAAPLLDKYSDYATTLEWRVEEWTRLDPDKLRNTTFDERQPLVQAHWDRNDPNYRENNAESLNDLFNRVDAMLMNLSIRYEDRVAIFTHGHFMRATYWTLMRYSSILGPHHMRRFRAFTDVMVIPNTMVAEIKPSGSNRGPYEWFVDWNVEGLGTG